MADFPTVLSNVVDNTDDVMAKYINNIEAKLGIGAGTAASATEGQTLTRNKTAGTSVWSDSPGQDSLLRQSVINGNFDIWQRGISFANKCSEYGPDRWGLFRESAQTAWTISQQTAGLAGSRYSCRAQRNVGDTSTKYIEIAQCGESLNSLPLTGKRLTLSFYAKCGANFSPTTANLSIGLSTGTGTDQHPDINGWTGSVAMITATQALTTSWVKYEFTSGALGEQSTLFGDSNAANEWYLKFSFTPVGTAGDNDWFEVTQVKLEAGAVATPFCPKSYQQELADCRRYCYAITTVAVAEAIAHGPASSTTVAYPSIVFPVEMRKKPIIFPAATAADWQLDDSINAPTDVTALVIDDLTMSSSKMAILKVSAASGLTANRPYYLVGDGSAGRILIFEADLGMA